MNIKTTFSLLSIFVFATPAAMASYVTFPDYVVMPKQRQIQVVEMLQDYIVESEYQSRALLEKNSPEYTWWNQISESFTAYAAGATAVENSSCMYGGWLSVAYKNSRNRLLCSNPKKIRSARTDYERKARLGMVKDQELREELELSSKIYQSSYDDIANGDYVMIDFKTTGGLNIELHPSPHSSRPCQVEKRGDIICNPTIFGAPDGKPLCVPGDEDKRGFNSSYLCQQAVKLIKEKGLGNKTEMENGSSKVYNDMMDKVIADSITSEDHRNLFLSNLQRMYTMCMCAQDKDYKSHSNKVNKEFANLMFNTRTCVGVLNQTREVLKQVQASGSCKATLAPTDNFNWENFAEKALTNLNKEIDVLDKIASSVTTLDRNIKVADPFNSSETLKISEIRKAAVAQRAPQSYCHVDLEAPDVVEPPKKSVSCELQIGWNTSQDAAFIKGFTPGGESSMSDFNFSLKYEDVDGKKLFRLPAGQTQLSVTAKHNDIECVSNTLSKSEYLCELSVADITAEGSFPIELTLPDSIEKANLTDIKWSSPIEDSEAGYSATFKDGRPEKLSFKAKTKDGKQVSCSAPVPEGEAAICKVKSLAIAKYKNGDYWTGSFEINKDGVPLKGKVSTELEGINAKEKSFKLPKDTMDQVSFSVNIKGQSISCMGVYEAPETEQTCSVELSLEPGEGGVYVRAENALHSGEEVDFSNGDYSLEFFNTSIEFEETTEESEDEMVDAIEEAPKKRAKKGKGPRDGKGPKKEAKTEEIIISGAPIALEDDNSVFIESSQEDQIIKALMTTPDGCEATAETEVKATPEEFKLDPAFKKPNLQNPNIQSPTRRRGGFFMRGTN
ncbi:MAG: hypothetical protein KC478_06030 [Bacteriovoracaceae bacterium]|nr:hypothetical protein [Bacteriovoracaceae bacterium]